MKQTGLLVLAVLLAVSPAAGICGPAKVFTTWDFTDFTYYYVYNFSGDLGASNGTFWEPGSRGTVNEGAYGIENWLRFYEPTSQWYISGNLGNGDVAGCPAGDLVLVMSEDLGFAANFAVTQSDETPAKAAHYNFPNISFQPVPRPQVVSSSRQAGSVFVEIRVADLDPAFSSRFAKAASEYITAVHLVSYLGTSDPGRNASHWSVLQTVPYAGGQTMMSGIEVICGDPQNQQYLAIRLQVAGEFDTAHVSAPTVIECSPTLADPDDRFRRIRRDRGDLKRGQAPGPAG